MSLRRIRRPKDVPADGWINGMPQGLWYFVGQPWTRKVWSHGAADRQWHYEVDVSACRILVIRDAIDAHAAMLNWELPLPDPDADSIELTMRTTGHPDWAKLALEFDGVEVRNNPRKKPSHWHTWFDCPSGCIWNASKIRLTLRRKPLSVSPRIEVSFPITRDG